MFSNPYSQYKYLGEYARNVGTFCSLLFNNDFCVPNEIDKILTKALLFKNIEGTYNPLLFTSDEHVWIPIFLQDEQFSDKFSKEDKDKLLSFGQEQNLEFDWLSWWCGYIIALLAIRYDVPMSKIVSIMSFEEFMDFAVVLHAQPEDYMFENFDNCEKNDLKLPKKETNRALFELNGIYILKKREKELLLSCVGLSDVSDELIVATDYWPFNYYGVMGALSALFPNENITITKAKMKKEPVLKEVSKKAEIQDAIKDDYDGVKIANWLGSWSQRKEWYEHTPNGDRGKYLRDMMSYVLLLKPEWCKENFEDSEEIVLSAEALADIANNEAQRRSGYMSVPLRVLSL